MRVSWTSDSGSLWRRRLSRCLACCSWRCPWARPRVLDGRRGRGAREAAAVWATRWRRGTPRVRERVAGEAARAAAPARRRAAPAALRARRAAPGAGASSEAAGGTAGGGGQAGGGGAVAVARAAGGRRRRHRAIRIRWRRGCVAANGRRIGHSWRQAGGGGRRRFRRRFGRFGKGGGAAGAGAAVRLHGDPDHAEQRRRLVLVQAGACAFSREPARLPVGRVRLERRLRKGDVTSSSTERLFATGTTTAVELHDRLRARRSRLARVPRPFRSAGRS